MLEGGKFIHYKMKKAISVFISLVSTTVAIYAVDPHGAHLVHENHDSPLMYIYLGVGVLIIIAFLGFWLYNKIVSNKETITEGCGTIFIGLLIFGGICLVGKCGETVNKYIKSEDKGVGEIENNNSPDHITNPIEPQASSAPEPYVAPQTSSYPYDNTRPVHSENAYNPETFDDNSWEDNFEYSIFDSKRTRTSRVKDPNFKINTVSNPNRESVGISGINQRTQDYKTCSY